MFEAVGGCLPRRPSIARSCSFLMIAVGRHAGIASAQAIVASPKPMHLLIIVIYRDTDLSPITRSPHCWRTSREHGITRIAMGGLDEKGVIEFVTAAIGHVLNQAQLEMARAISRNTEGSPLFVGEVLRNFADRVHPSKETEQTTRGDFHIGIPEGIKEAIARRLARFSLETNKLLRIASVIGLEFDWRCLRASLRWPKALFWTSSMKPSPPQS